MHKYAWFNLRTVSSFMFSTQDYDYGHGDNADDDDNNYDDTNDDDDNDDDKL